MSVNPLQRLFAVCAPTELVRRRVDTELDAFTSDIHDCDYRPRLADWEHVMKYFVRSTAAFALATMLCSAADTQVAAQSNSQAAMVVPVKVGPALDGVFKAFKSNSVVALGDPHGLAAQMDFYTAVVRDPRFAREVRNLVVEFGASSQQQVIDRYVAGETVPYVELRKVWNDTVGWAPPPALVGFVKFFAAVRDINKSRPGNRRIKIWLGEPPLDWTAPSREDIRAAMRARDTYPATLIRDKILAKGEKALVIYGAFHFANGPMLKGQLDATHPGSLFVILPYAPPFQYPSCAPLLSQVTAFWPKPALATRSRDKTDAGLGSCFTLSPPVGGPGPGGPRPDRSGPAGPAPGAPGPGGGAPFGGGPPTIEGDGLLFLGPLDKLAQGPFLPDYFLDPELRREIKRRSNFGGPRLLSAPSRLAIRRADYAFDLDAPGFREQIDKLFAANDRDGDGVITSGEYGDPSE
jgi:hypothetical protein